MMHAMTIVTADAGGTGSSTVTSMLVHICHHTLCGYLRLLLVAPSREDRFLLVIHLHVILIHRRPALGVRVHTHRAIPLDHVAHHPTCRVGSDAHAMVTVLADAVLVQHRIRPVGQLHTCSGVPWFSVSEYQ